MTIKTPKLSKFGRKCEGRKQSCPIRSAIGKNFALAFTADGVNRFCVQREKERETERERETSREFNIASIRTSIPSTE